MARTKITSPQLNPSKTTDANGWTVYDYGTWKEYRKRVTFSQSVSTAVVLSLSSASLPSGVSTLGTRIIQGTKTTSGAAYGLNWGFEMVTSSSALNITVSSSAGTVTYTGWIDITITEV